jgi:hypothetical protein
MARVMRQGLMAVVVFFTVGYFAGCGNSNTSVDPKTAGPADPRVQRLDRQTQGTGPSSVSAGAQPGDSSKQSSKAEPK